MPATSMSAASRPEAKINQKRLAGDLGISRTPLIDALKYLEKAIFVTYAQEVRTGVFPDEAHSYKMSDEALEAIETEFGKAELTLCQNRPAALPWRRPKGFVHGSWWTKKPLTYL